MSDEVSKAESRVVEFLKEGYTNSQIADKLCVSEKTVKFHLTSIYKKYDVKSRSEFLALMNGHSKHERDLIVDNYNNKKSESNLPIPQTQAITSQQDKIRFIDQQFNIGKTVEQLHHMVTEVTKKEINPATVNAACNCIARLNETVNTAIQAARFLNER